MERIVLRGIHKENGRFDYDFSISDGLKPYFSGRPFFVEYPMNVSDVPDGVAVIPFVCSVLPLVWIADAILEIPELDKAFYLCLPELKQGYAKMYPETIFSGELQVGKIVDCTVESAVGCGMFFSGGLDSVETLIRLLPEKPALLSIWGSDVQCDNADGWENVHNAICEYSQRFQLKEVVIRSGFRDFDMEWELDKVYQVQLKANWWYGVKHGIALLGHAAPYAWKMKLSTVYIASSNSEEEGNVRCASDPTLDNHIRYASCRVVHDGYVFGRQEKVHNLVEFAHRTGVYLPLHVCWTSQSGSNCCECEKCYRTMMGLIAEGENPVNYGFLGAEDTLGKMRQVLVGEKKITENVALEWQKIQNRIAENKEMLQTTPYWRHIKWIVRADIMHPETLRLPLSYRLRKSLAQFGWAQKLYGFVRSKIG